MTLITFWWLRSGRKTRKTRKMASSVIFAHNCGRDNHISARGSELNLSRFVCAYNTELHK